MQTHWLQINPCLNIKLMHQPLRERLSLNMSEIWVYRCTADLFSTFPPCRVTPPQHFSPLTSHSEGCRFRVQLLRFPLLDPGLITRAHSVLTGTWERERERMSHTELWKTLGKCPFEYEPSSEGQNSSAERETLLRFSPLLVLYGPIYSK